MERGVVVRDPVRRWGTRALNREKVKRRFPAIKKFSENTAPRGHTEFVNTLGTDMRHGVVATRTL